GLDSIARASAHLEDSTEQGAALLRALNQLERDIALHSAIREETGLPSGDEPIRAGDSLPPGLALKRLSEIPLRLDIVRASTEPGAPLQRVRWWRQGKVLYRAASPSGDRLPLPPLAERVAVLDDVSRFDIRAWVPGKGWTRLPARSKVRASGLEISLARVTRNGVERYRRVVALQ
ncbi:type II secretion system protein GspJ, partial [Pseudomonas aeruginosa]